MSTYDTSFSGCFMLFIPKHQSGKTTNSPQHSLPLQKQLFLKMIEQTLTLEKLQQFFEERPTLSHHGIGKQAELSASLLGKILRNERKLTDETIEKLMPVIMKYGYGR